MSITLQRPRRPRLCNDALARPLDEVERARMIAAASSKIEELFDILEIDHRNDHNTRDTPRRVAKMYVQELMSGRFSEPPRITEFDNATGFDQLIVTGPIDLRSTCAHHLMPIYGSAYVGILPAADGKILGLSKYDRIVEYFAARLQIQEDLVRQIGRYIEDVTSPRGIAVRISAVHLCKVQRGVRSTHRSRMVSSAFFGEMLTDHRLQDQFLRECVALERD